MDRVTRLILLEITIEKNLEALKEAFREGYRIAMWDRFNAGVRKAFDKINTLFPKNIRDGLSFGECMIFNTRVQTTLAEYFV